MARTRSENYDAIQRGILAKAAQVFAAQGYMRASIGDLAKACGLSRGALYHYFESKDAILFAILDQHVREFIAHVEAAVAAGGSPAAQLRLAVRAMVAFNARSPAEQKVLLSDLPFLDKKGQQTIKGLERQLIDTVANFLVELDSEGKIGKRTRTVYTMILFGIINYAHTWYDPKRGVAPPEFADIAVDVFLDGFRAPHRARTRPSVERSKA
jgi:AcrR family transcriptional regulator